MQTNCFIAEKYRANLKNEHEVLLSGLDPASIASTDSFKLLTDRLDGGSPLRARFVVMIKNYVSYENGTTKYIKITHILSYLMEALMVVFYYDNLIYDRKKQVYDHESICRTLQTRNSLYDAINRYISKRPQISNKLRIELLDLVRDIHNIVNEGQKIERNFNFYGSWSLPLNERAPSFDLLTENQAETTIAQAMQIVTAVFPFPEDKLVFLKNYLQRIYMTSAFLFVRLTRFCLQRSNVGMECAQNMLNYAGLFGIMHQIVNDVTDFKPAFGADITATKDHQDDLKDLRNKNITLPLMIHLLKAPESKIKTFLDHPAYPGNFFPEVYSDDICASSAIYIAMKAGKEMSKTIIPLLNPENPYTTCLTDAARIAENNRFYRYFYDRKFFYEKYLST